MLDEKYITKYLNHELTEEETAEVVKWLEEDKKNQELLFSIKEAHLLSHYPAEATEADTAREWEKFKKQIGMPEEKTAAIRMYGSIRNIAVYAAIIIACVFIGWKGNEVYKEQSVKNLTQSIETGAGQQVKTTLPDGSTVCLNACTYLSYSPYTWKKQRLVRLKGEAIFEVSSNLNNPFIVATANYDVFVTGTNFNVSAYEEDGKTITTLKRGKVEIHSAVRKEFMAELSPGESLIFDNTTKEYTIRKLPVRNVYAWNYKEIIFEGNTLSEKQSELSRHFGYTFRIAPELQGLTYKATLRDESLAEFMGILARLTPGINYRISDQDKTVEIYPEK